MSFLKEINLIVILTICCSQAVAATSQKTISDEMFPYPKDKGDVQVTLGVVDVALASTLAAWAKHGPYAGEISGKESKINSLEKALKGDGDEIVGWRNVPTREDISQKISDIEEFQRNPVSTTRVGKLFEKLDLKSELKRLRGQLTEAVTEAEKLKTIAEIERKLEIAGEQLAQLREKALLHNQNLSTKGKIFRGLKVVGSAIFILDLSGRIIVWNYLDKDPMLLPIGTAGWYAYKKLFGSHAEAAEPSNGAVSFESGQEPET